jgi:hypothetical protein
MNWIKENKFLFGFIVVLALGLGVGGFFVFSAKGHYDDAFADYQQKAGELNRLKRLAIYPNDENLKSLAGQKDQVNAEVSALATALSAQQIPVEDLSPEQFQDKLKASVTAIRTKASQNTPPTKLPDKYFLGFERYETAPPAREAAGPLGAELKAIEWLNNTLLDNRLVELKKVDREELPEEKGRGSARDKKPAATPAPTKGASGKSPKESVNHQAEKHRIELTFVADQLKFRQIVNAIAGYKGQFFIIRTMNVKNEKQTAPVRAVAGAPGSPDGAAVPADPSAPAASAYILGEEKVEVVLALELVEFSEAAPATPAK